MPPIAGQKKLSDEYISSTDVLIEPKNSILNERVAWIHRHPSLRDNDKIKVSPIVRYRQWKWEDHQELCLNLKFPPEG